MKKPKYQSELFNFVLFLSYKNYSAMRYPSAVLM